ncbi:FAM192A-like protein [Euroglyphus maynei]|uniref:FAM192A-like protein n=1 Tax=Euroglyphus maynei TaxID=6958 RepID=A0A1Y3AQB7_EURMA|nr:FAM192A-like protein [Euroglyphus maynei]
MAKNISFVSESVLDEQRKHRQEEWLKNRKESDPIEAPEPEYDPRTLYERLQEQKQKKQEEFDESRKMKNLVKVLDNDEIEFLAICNNSKAELENQKYREELLALEEYKHGVAHLNNEEQEHKLSEFKRELFQNHKKRLANQSLANGKRKSQADLLMGAIKRKSKDESLGKKIETDSTTTTTITDENPVDDDNSKIKFDPSKPTIQCIGRLPGIGCYDDESDSLESDCESNESDCTDFNAFGHKLAELAKSAAEMQQKNKK